ncbi:MAG: AMP-binding protein, partial [bacterium]|nr:AMP-binding protein [bacterium]
MYTSGSTGRPRGVMVEHRNVVRLVKNNRFFRFQPQQRILQTGALSFDASTFEVWGALLNGLSLCLTHRDNILSAAALKRIIETYRITTVWMTSALFNQQLQSDTGIFKGLSHLLVGGDVVSVPHVNRLKEIYPELVVINGYGPTENTTFSTTYTIDEIVGDSIPIGTPISNSTAYVVDRYDNLVPVGVIGELLVGGDGVARGYLNNPELTSEKFIPLTKLQAQLNDAREANQIPDHTAPPRSGYPLPAWRGYRTGDLVRLLPDGNIQFIGRMDSQVKIRGFRIEPGEIENRLSQLDGIGESAVVVLTAAETGEKILCAYYTVPGESVSKESKSGQEKTAEILKQNLSGSLPSYMIPTHFIQLEQMPLTPNGKVDRKALPEPGISDKQSVTPPATAAEKQLALTWTEVLGIPVETIGIQSDFFQLGGHSLKAAALTAKIHKAFDVELPLTEVFRNPSIGSMAVFIEKAAKVAFKEIEAYEKREYYPLSSAQKRMYLLQYMAPDNTHYNIPQTIPIGPGTDREKLETTLRQLIARHESLRTSFHMHREEPVQVIHKTADCRIQYFDSPTVSLGDFVRPFDLSSAPLFRVGLVKGPDSNFTLLVDIHHIVSDGASQEVLAREFAALYNGQTLRPLRLQYKDFTLWQRSRKYRQNIKEQESYWLEKFSGELPVVTLPRDFPRPAVQSFEGAALSFMMEAEAALFIRRLGAENHTTLFMVMLSLLNVLFSRLSGQEDIVIGTPVAGRPHADLQDIIGMFVNTLPLRHSPLGATPFTTFLAEVRTKTLEAFENRDYPFEDIV